jgi:ISXO2-like transposase domain
VAIAVEDRGEASGRVRMRRIADVTKATLTAFVLDHVARASEVRTDGRQGYFDVGRHPFTHMVTNVSASGDPARVVMPHVHRVASLVQRWLLGTERARSATTSSTTTSTSSRFASTGAARAIADCSSIDCLRAPWPPTPTPTKPSPANPPLEQIQSQIGGEKRIAHSRGTASLPCLRRPICDVLKARCYLAATMT